jgi:putative phosphoribosyl transferase
MSVPFRDRHDAGRQLADRLHCYAGRDPIVLGVPRGGVPVAYEIAHALRAPLDIMLLRHLALPDEHGPVFGFVASGGVRVLDAAAVRALELAPETVDEITHRERISLMARERTYRSRASVLDVRDRVVILADDGTAPLPHLIDLVAAVRDHEPRAVILAAPVLSRAAADEMRLRADDLSCVVTCTDDVAPDRWYHELLPISHTEVRALLALNEAEAQSRELASASGHAAGAGLAADAVSAAAAGRGAGSR